MSGFGLAMAGRKPGGFYVGNTFAPHGFGSKEPYPQPAPALGAYTDRVGFNTAFRIAPGLQSSYYGWAPDINVEMAQFVAQGFHWLRDFAEWRFLEPTTKGVYAWASLDTVMNAAEAHGISMLLCISGTPTWATASTDDYHWPPDNLTDYADFCVAVVNRYRGYACFKAVELWNEPWLGAGFGWGPDPEPVKYAAMAREAAQRIKATGAMQKVLAVGDYYVSTSLGDTTSPFFGAVVDAEPTLPTYVDGWAIHPYVVPRTSGPHDQTLVPYQQQFQRVARLRDELLYRGIDQPVWITEVGWSNATGLPSSGVSEATSAVFLYDMLARALIEMRGTSYRRQIERVFIHFYWRSVNPADTSNLDGNYALMRADGTYKPAWDEIRKFR